jgi:hypothetical protein
MKSGMLWLDADAKRSLEEKVQRAADYYREKYGRAPDLCLVNPTLLAADKAVGPIVVQPLRSVMPNYFWLGMRNSG